MHLPIRHLRCDNSRSTRYGLLGGIDNIILIRNVYYYYLQRDKGQNITGGDRLWLRFCEREMLSSIN